MNLEDIESILSNDPLSIIPEENNDEIVDNWNIYCNSISGQINSMWNFILYNQFNNNEIRRLQNELSFLKDQHRNTLDDYDNLKSNYDDAVFSNKRLKRKLEKMLDEEDTGIECESVKRKRNTLLLEKNKLDNFVEIDKKLKNETILHIFEKLESINDIINLKNFEHKYSYTKNNKFCKLYNLIPTLEELNNIIGMEDIKHNIFKSICYFLHGFQNNKELNHVMITGSPGVGKSTIARIIGKIYLELGFLQNNKFITARRSDLIAKYLGQTAIKTQEVIDKALGGVLFIDEVYSLGSNEKRDSFAKECIDTINLNMTEAKKPWLLIVGGYKEDIENSFLAYNKGLERRFTVRLNIAGYNATELFLILKKFIKDDNWNFEDNSIFEKDIEDNLSSFKFFAGDMQKLFQKAKQYNSIRCMKKNIDLNVNEKILNRDDFEKALEYVTSNTSKKEELDKNIMFSMYT